MIIMSAMPRVQVLRLEYSSYDGGVLVNNEDGTIKRAYSVTTKTIQYFKKSPVVFVKAEINIKNGRFCGYEVLQILKTNEWPEKKRTIRRKPKK